MNDFLIISSLVFLSFSVLVLIYRIYKGPTAPDRIQALDALNINIISGIAIISVFLRSTAFFEVILLLGILSFIGTIALSRYIERGITIERDSE